MHRAPTAAIVASALALVSVPAYAVTHQTSGAHLLAATAPPASPASTASTPAPKPFTPPAAPAGASSGAPAVTIKPSSTWKVQVDPTGKRWLSASWPTAESVFSQSELAQAIPGLTGVQVSACDNAGLPGGESSAHTTTCTLTLLVNGAPSNIPTRLLIDIRGFGTPDQIGKPWQSEFAQQQARAAKRPGLYTFFANSNNGAAASYTDGTTTRVLLTKGAVTGEIWFSGVGFTFLDNDYTAARAAYRERIVPELVQLLAAKMATVQPPK